MTESEPTYGEALEELRAIHARISSVDVDVDRLLEDVQRAAYLLELCRTRITAIGERLEEVLEDFE